jgi:hypothetical protein
MPEPFCEWIVLVDFRHHDLFPGRREIFVLRLVDHAAQRCGGLVSLESGSLHEADDDFFSRFAL